MGPLFLKMPNGRLLDPNLPSASLTKVQLCALELTKVRTAANTEVEVEAHAAGDLQHCLCSRCTAPVVNFGCRKRNSSKTRHFNFSDFQMEILILHVCVVFCGFILWKLMKSFNFQRATIQSTFVLRKM